MAIDWSTIHAERAALAEDLAGLTAEQWRTPSLCSEWTVHEVLAHQVATARMTPGRFVRRFAAARFDFDRFSTRNVAEEAEGGPERTLAQFRSLAGATSAPPGPGDSWLGEALVHGEDIRRPLGIAHEAPFDALARAITFYAGSNALIGGKRRVDGVRLVATDGDFSLGSGPEASGPALALLLATTGRRVALGELSGPGAEVLSSR